MIASGFSAIRVIVPKGEPFDTTTQWQRTYRAIARARIIAVLSQVRKAIPRIGEAFREEFSTISITLFYQSRLVEIIFYRCCANTNTFLKAFLPTVKCGFSTHFSESMSNRDEIESVYPIPLAYNSTLFRRAGMPTSVTVQIAPQPN